jgi:hypothetical protein
MAPKRDSIVVCTYGPSGIGKTTDQGYSFPRALFVAAPGALNSVRSVCGYMPATVQIATIMDATKLIKTYSKDYNTIVIDDFSFLSEQTFSTLEKKFKGFLLWGELRDQALEFRDTARFSGVDVILNCWEQGPKVAANGGKLRGGPMLSGRLPEAIPAMCDLVLRATHEPQRKPWGAAYRCSPDPSYIMKDRFNIASLIDPAPMNLAEILRAANIPVERHPDAPDQEEIVEGFTQKMMTLDNPVAQANEFYKLLLDSGVAVPAARWILRDAMDRTNIRKALANVHSSFINVTSGMTL